MFLGIDVAKASFDAAVIKDNGKAQHKVFANTEAGFEQLQAWLRDHGADGVPACMEATGTYGEALANFLHQRGHKVSVVNPARIRAFAQSQLSRTKTDKADARLIALFCQRYQPAPWTAPSQEVRQLQALVRRLAALEQMRQMERNRLAAGAACEMVKASLEETLAFVQEQIARTKKQIKEHIDQDPTLKQQRDLLTSIPGVAETTAAAVLAELGDINQFDSARQVHRCVDVVAAFAGLVPKIRQSGSSVRGRSC